MTNPIHVLVVEDTPIAQMVAKVQLTKLGCLVDLAPDGIIALEKAMLIPYDLILMDIGLGAGPDGFEVTSQIKMKSTVNKTTPIIAITAHGEAEYIEKALKVGMERYFNKPLTPDDAKNIIGELLNRPFAEKNSKNRIE